MYIGYYKGFPSNSLSFSSDGSVLAVAFGSCLTLWLPDSCHMKTSLVHSNYKSPIKTVQFGNADQCHLVATASEDHLCVWNILTLGLTWTVPVKVKLLCSDPCSNYVAAITSKNNCKFFCGQSRKDYQIIYFQYSYSNPIPRISYLVKQIYAIRMKVSWLQYSFRTWRNDHAVCHGRETRSCTW